MARYQMSTRCAWTQEQAFAYMADIRNFAKWDPGVVAVTRVPEADEGKPPGFEASYDLVVKSGGTSTFRYQVTNFAAPNSYVMVASNRWVRSVDEISVVPNVGGGCTVRYDAELTLNGRLSIFDFALAIAFRRIGDRAAAGLRKALSGAKP